MIKQELLASLKPLEWKCNLYFCAEIAGRIMRAELIPAHKEYHVKIFGWDKSINCGRYSTIDEAKKAAQEHYNNLVLNLFNLED